MTYDTPNADPKPKSWAAETLGELVARRECEDSGEVAELQEAVIRLENVVLALETDTEDLVERIDELETMIGHRDQQIDDLKTEINHP